MEEQDYSQIWGEGVHGAPKRREEEIYYRPGALPLWSKGRVSGVLRFSSLLANLKHQRRIRVLEGRSVATKVVSYLGYPRISKEEALWWGGGLRGHPNSLCGCFASSCVI